MVNYNFFREKEVNGVGRATKATLERLDHQDWMLPVLWVPMAYLLPDADGEIQPMLKSPNLVQVLLDRPGLVLLDPPVQVMEEVLDLEVKIAVQFMER